jgi:hypothetical protein
MADGDSKPAGAAETREQIRARFLKETAHLGPERQRRIVAAIREVAQAKREREAAAVAVAAIDKARAT